MLGEVLGEGQCWLYEAEVFQEPGPEFLACDARLTVRGGEVHLVRGADAAVAHDDDAVRQGDRLVDIVGDEQHGSVVLGPQRAHEVVHAQPCDGVEGRERLVEQHEFGLRDQCPGERHPLGLAARELLGPCLLTARESDLGKHLAGPRLRIGSVQAERDVAQHPLPRQQPIGLEDDRTPCRDLHPPAVGPVESGEQPQQGALAAARGAEQDHQLLVGDGEVEVVEHHPVTEPADHLLDDHPGLPTGLRRDHAAHDAS